MTFTPSPSVLSPAAISVQADITSDDMLEIVRGQGYSTTHYGECHLSLTTAEDEWDDHAAYGPEPEPAFPCAVGPMGILATDVLETEIVTDIWIDPDHALGTLELGVEGKLGAANTVEVTFELAGNVGTSSKVVTLTDADNGTEVVELKTLEAVTTGGWVMVEIKVQRTAGALGNEIRALRIEELELETLPDPSDD